MRIIRNYDVASYYPHLMTICGYTSRNIPSAKVYEDMLERRIKAKREGNKALANSLKLVANTTYGATLNQYNDLYDPLMARSVCISGQLYLIELSNHLLADVPGLTIIDLNTDGVMISFDDEYYDRVKEITTEWQQRTGFELEEDKIQKIVHKDVSNYLEISTSGDLKIKGADLVRGVAPAGAFNINNNNLIIAEAVRDYLAYGKDIEETITECKDILKFASIAKVSAKYGKVYQKFQDGHMVEVQRCNRVYACSDYNYGTLYKTNLSTGTYEKVAGLPLSCFIDNSNMLEDFSMIDVDWYIRTAKVTARAFTGEKPFAKRNTRTVNKLMKEVKEALNGEQKRG